MTQIFSYSLLYTLSMSTDILSHIPVRLKPICNHQLTLGRYVPTLEYWYV